MQHLKNGGADLILVSLDMPFFKGLIFLELLTDNNRLKNKKEDLFWISK